VVVVLEHVGLSPAPVNAPGRRDFDYYLPDSGKGRPARTGDCRFKRHPPNLAMTKLLPGASKAVDGGPGNFRTRDSASDLALASGPGQAIDWEDK